jgi:hypothetical protein
MYGETQLYNMQRGIEQLGIGGDCLRENGLSPFHLGALGRLTQCVLSPVLYIYILPFLVADKWSWVSCMYSRACRLYPHLDASWPEAVTESNAARTIQALHTLVVQFMRGIVQRGFALRELNFALCAHTKV